MNLYRQGDCGPLDLDMTVGDILGLNEEDFTDEYEDGSDEYDLDGDDVADVTDLTDATVAPVDDATPAAARLQQDTQGDLGTLNGDVQAGIADSQTIFQQLLTQGEAALDNSINTVETATGFGDADVGASARIQQTQADVTTDVNTVIEDATGAFDATVEGINAQLNTGLSAFAPQGAAPAAARRLQRFR
jgi:hypothetical protein